MNSKEINKITVLLFTAAMCGVGQNALAHTGIKDTGTEGVALYSAFTIGHGCASNVGGETAATGLGVDGNTAQKDVIAQTVLFPNAIDSEAYQIDADGFPVGSKINIGDHISGVTNGILPLSPNITYPQVFPESYVVREADGSTRGTGGTVRGFQTWGGVLPEGGGTVGLAGFKVSGVNFKPTSCAKSLKVRIAIANYCHAGTMKKDKESNRVDVWIGDQTPKFNDPLVMPNAAGTLSPKATIAENQTKPAFFWPTLTIKRTTAFDPASNCGDGFDVAIQPSVADIDDNLPLKLPTKSHRNLPGKKFWPNI